VTQARAEWPSFAIDSEEFRDHLERLFGDETIDDIAIHVSDLYLACACGRGLPAAIVAVERLCLGDLEGIVGRHRGPHVGIDDVRQMLREKLLVAAGDKRPKILEYSGRGSLRGWIRVVATRLTLNLATRGPKDTPQGEDEDEALLDLADQDDQADVRYMRVLYSEELRSVFPEALSRLTARERLLLRQRYVDGVSLDELSTLHGVHRATAKRWLAQARETVASSLRELLSAKLGVSESEVNSMVRAVQSRFHMTLGRMFSVA